MDYATGVSHIEGGIYMGGASAIYQVPELREAGITNVLKLYFQEPAWPSDFVVCDNPIDDGVFIERETLERGVAFMDRALLDGGKVLVVCGVGISRSATFVLAYLLEHGYDLHAAFNLVRQGRPQAWPMRALWESLITHYHAPYTLTEIETWLGSDLPLV